MCGPSGRSAHYSCSDVLPGRFQLCRSLRRLPLPASTSSSGQDCPPACGKVAAGDPLLIPYVTVNPGLGWLAAPASEAQSYVDELKRNLAGSGTHAAPLSNVAAAKWTWLNDRYDLLIVLVSSGQLGASHLDNPRQNAADLCASSHGQPSSQLVSVPGVPGSVSGLCRLRPGSAFKGATVTAFTRRKRRCPGGD